MSVELRGLYLWFFLRQRSKLSLVLKEPYDLAFRLGKEACPLGVPPYTPQIMKSEPLAYTRLQLEKSSLWFLSFPSQSSLRSHAILCSL